MAMKGGGNIVLLCVVVFSIMIKTTEGDGYGTIFVFGDSILDVGTNNHFNNCKARADHPYYGIDYPDSMATGRFSNGLNSADLLVGYISDYTSSPPPFLKLVYSSATFQQDILHGANFASGGSGILADTGHHKFRRVVPFWEQIQQFATVCGNISDFLGTVEAEIFIQNSFYLISIGSNDFFDYQEALFHNKTTPEKLMANLTTTFATHLQNLYDLGARKFGIIGVPPLGCCPIQRHINVTTGGNGGCVVAMNDLAQAFHVATETLLKNFSSTNEGVVYSLGNAYRTIMNFIDNPRGSGFEVVQTACCGNGTFNAVTGCEFGSNLCINRDDYLFWDGFHPTQAAARKAALTLAYADGPEFVTPMNFSSLVKAWIYT